MRLATIRTASGTGAVRIDGDEAIECGESDVGALLASADWAARAGAADGPRHQIFQALGIDELDMQEALEVGRRSLPEGEPVAAAVPGVASCDRAAPG